MTNTSGYEGGEALPVQLSFMLVEYATDSYIHQNKPHGRDFIAWVLRNFSIAGSKWQRLLLHTLRSQEDPKPKAKFYPDDIELGWLEGSSTTKHPSLVWT